MFDDVESLSKRKGSQLRAWRALEEGWTHESEFDPVPNGERDLRRSHRGGREVVVVEREASHLLNDLLSLAAAQVDTCSSFSIETQI